MKHIEMARTHKNAEVRRLNREIWCSHICQAQFVGWSTQAMGGRRPSGEAFCKDGRRFTPEHTRVSR